MHTNRLANEKSPYLLQHAHNPVDWYAWGPEAFEKARAEEKPVFLSIGYSTCHWCHVMERESFENEEIAAVLNRHFVPIKVDREERPDVDRVYMLFVQATTGGGGWPMSVWLTPELKPFYGGTYFPPDNRYGRPGFRTVLESLARAWASDRAKIEESSVEVTRQLAEQSGTGPAASVIDKAVLDSAFFGFRRTFDTRLGGFGAAPKFPRPAVHNFLVRYYARTHKDEALEMVLTTLREMAKGGMHDQIGGGFHRYSVDERWFVPHFEKMLYDQAQLAVSYLEAYQITRDEFFAATARDIFEYVLRDLAHPEGGFYSAEDADSALDAAQPNVKGEGAFYIWSHDELARLLDPNTFAWFRYAYGVEADGNVRDDPHGEFRGRNVLYQAHTIEETAAKFGGEPDVVRAGLAAARERLLASRANRPRPHLDDKVLTAWNGLMISAFAKGSQVLGNDPLYAHTAQRAAEFILAHMYDPAPGTLLRRFREGEAAIPAFLDDYAFFVVALLDVYETEFDTRYLDLGVRLAAKMVELFEDCEGGGFFNTEAGDSNLILRMKDDYDGAEPSGNSMAALALFRLAHITGREDFREVADRTLRAFAGRMASMGMGLPQMLVAAMTSLWPPRQVVLAGPKQDAAGMLRIVRRYFLPETPVLLVDDGARPELARYSPVLAAMKPLDGRMTVYVCQNFACQLPTTDAAKMAELLQ